MGSISQRPGKKEQADNYRYLAVNLGDEIESGEIDGVISIRVPTGLTEARQLELCKGLNDFLAENFPETIEIKKQ